MEAYNIASSDIMSEEEQKIFLQQECKVMLRYYYKKVEEGDRRTKNEILIEWIEINSAGYRKFWIREKRRLSTT